MKLIVGLGNPGRQYEKTRHNLGFMIVERFLKDFEPVEKTAWEDSKKFKSDIVHLEWQRRSSHSSLGKTSFEKVVLAKPKTYMNNSGMAVSLIAEYYKINPLDILVVHDDIDLPLGAMKIRFGGASAGHHGIDSVIKTLKTDRFWRFRMGTGAQNTKYKIQNAKLRNAEDFVLKKFTGHEWGKTRELIKRGSKALQTALEEGLEASQNRFNTK